MSMDCVKMGRIPKKIKEKALRKHRKRQEKMRNVKVQDMTISSTDALSHHLSLLRLPTIFSSFSSPSPESIEYHNDLFISDGNNLTVTRYISTISENIIVNYMHNCESRYSKNVLGTMKYFLPRLCQPFLLYELDYELMSFFRYLRWKILNSYLKHTTHLRRLIRRMLGIIDLKVKMFSQISLINRFGWID